VRVFVVSIFGAENYMRALARRAQNNGANFDSFVLPTNRNRAGFETKARRFSGELWRSRWGERGCLP
jgi:hypothetical protein